MFFSSNFFFFLEDKKNGVLVVFMTLIIKLLSYRSHLCGSLLTLSILVSNLWMSCRMKGGGWLERERERAKEKERKGERTSPIFIAWPQNENDTLWWRTQEGEIRHWQMGWNEMSAITCVACVFLLVCTRTPVSLWYTYGHGQSPPCTLCLPLLCLPISASRSLSLSHTHTSYNTTEWGKRVWKLPLIWRLWYLR